LLIILIRMYNLYSQNKINTIVEYLLDSNTYASTTSQHANKLDFSFFNGQYYEPNAESQIIQQIKQHFPKVHFTDKEISKIIGQIQDLSIITDDFDNPRYVGYLNGIHDTQTNQLLPFSPHYLISFQINQNFIQQEEFSSLSLLAQRLALA
jgi:hypothetical protein